jgi:exocyst complex component 2
MEIANTIDEKLFADYTRRRAKVIREIVKKGILDGIDWSTLKQPFGTARLFAYLTLDVQQYVHQALLSLVITHAQVSNTSPAILPRVMAALVESFAADLLSCYRKVPSFCMGGMLQATLEVEFLHQTLGSNVSKTAGDTLQAVYGTIEKAYVGAGGVDLELSKVKGLLQRSRASTKYVYACFKSSRKGTVREGSSSSSSRTGSVRTRGGT